VDVDQVLNLTVQFEDEGRYQFDVEINGEIAGRTPLLVLVRPDLAAKGRLQVKVPRR
jgi:hypothetical protein